MASTLRAGTYAVSTQSRHSYESAGPRYKRYGPGGPEGGDGRGAPDDADD